MKNPKYTDLHRYRHGYRKSTETDITGTFRRVLREREANKLEADIKVKAIARKA